MLRKHQTEMLETMNDIVSGSGIRTILIKATPGAGKSMLPIIAGELIVAGKADALCWVCPRKTLQAQGERNFQDPLFRRMLGHRLSIRSSTNEQHPCRGLNGFVTTYQALAVDYGNTVQTEFASKRYILILDEYHHAEEGGIWHETLTKIEKLAAYVVLMTGTLERGNGTRIAFTQYFESKRGYQPNLSPSADTKIIEYSRQDALREQAIIPLTFFCHDGAVSWRDFAGDVVEHESISKVQYKDAGAAIYTAISTEYADELLKTGYDHFAKYKKTVYAGAKMLVVTAGIEQAKKAVEFFKNRGVSVELCTSHDIKKAVRAINKFKAGKTAVLVGIAIFYEGFDCKQVTHIIALTQIRSTPWLEQMFARAVRVDPDAGPYSTQCGYVFAPDDVLIRRVIDRIRKEQLPIIKQKRLGEQLPMFPAEGNLEGEPFKNCYDIDPLSSTLTGSRTLTIGSTNPPLPVVISTPEQPCPSEIEAELRKKIESHIRKFSFANWYKPQKINAEVKKHFGKTRDEMRIAELREVLNYIESEYPATSVRGWGRRVSSRAVMCKNGEEHG